MWVVILKRLCSGRLRCSFFTRIDSKWGSEQLVLIQPGVNQSNVSWLWIDTQRFSANRVKQKVWRACELCQDVLSWILYRYSVSTFFSYYRVSNSRLSELLIKKKRETYCSISQKEQLDSHRNVMISACQTVCEQVVCEYFVSGTLMSMRAYRHCAAVVSKANSTRCS